MVSSFTSGVRLPQAHYLPVFGLKPWQLGHKLFQALVIGNTT